MNEPNVGTLEIKTFVILVSRLNSGHNIRGYAVPI